MFSWHKSPRNFSKKTLSQSLVPFLWMLQKECLTECFVQSLQEVLNNFSVHYVSSSVIFIRVYSHVSFICKKQELRKRHFMFENSFPPHKLWKIVVTWKSFCSYHWRNSCTNPGPISVTISGSYPFRNF